MQIVLLSGRIRAGKSTLAQALKEQYGARVVKTRSLISKALPDIPYHKRSDFQRAGENLDAIHGGKWLGRGLLEEMMLDPDEEAIWIVDAVRTRDQVEFIRNAYRRAVHVHLSVSDTTADSRMRDKRLSDDFTEAASYKEAAKDSTEAKVEDLKEIADVAIDTERDRREDVVVRVAGQLGLLYVSPSSYADALIGGQFGSEGKGHIAWYLAQEYDYLVRVGGPNAGHKVPALADPDNPDLPAKPFTYHMLPSGTGESKAKVILGPGTTIDMNRLQAEIGQLRLEVDRLIVDEQAMVIDDEDKAFEAASLRGSIASTAQGGGYAAARRLMRGALESERPIRLARDVEELKPYIGDTARLLERAFNTGKRVFVEGTQGSGLSLYHGYYPYVTSRDTNVAGVLAESGIAPSRLRRVILVVRTYPIRVQNPDGGGVATSGPMSQELSLADIAARAHLDLTTLQETERTSTTNRQRRIGEFDWVLFARAVHLNSPTDIALTFADYHHASNSGARRFEQLHKDTQRFIIELERVGGAPVSLISTGFTTHSIIDRRNW